MRIVVDVQTGEIKYIEDDAPVAPPPAEPTPEPTEGAA